MGSPVAQVGNLSMLCHRLTTCATSEGTRVGNLCYEGTRVGNLSMVCHRLETCATGEGTQVENLCYGGTQVGNLCYRGNGQNS